jgi:hypothetical protein
MMLLHRHYPKFSAAGLAGVDLGAILSGETESEDMNVDAMVECSPDPGSTPGTSTTKKRPVENTLRRIGVYRGRDLGTNYNKKKEVMVMNGPKNQKEFNLKNDK